MQRSTTLLFLFLSIVCASVANAQWWWPFGSDRDDLTAETQTSRSEQLFRDAVAREEAGHLRSAARAYKKIFNDYPRSEFAAPALFNYAGIHYQRKNWKKSFDAFQRILQRYPEFPRFNEVIAFQFNIAIALAEGDGVRLLWVIPYKALNRSVAYFEIVVSNAPYSDLAPLALMNVAMIHRHQGNSAEAIDALDRLINNYPNTLVSDEAYLNLADTFASLVDGPEYDQGATREAISYYQDFLILFPENERVAIGEEGLRDMRNIYAASKLVIGEFYFHYRNWYQAAEIFFNEAITIAPDSESAARARDYIARITEFKERAKADPNYRPPRTTLGDRIFFWRDRNPELEVESGSASPAPAPEPTDNPFEVEE